MSTCPRSQEESSWNILKNEDKNQKKNTTEINEEQKQIWGGKGFRSSAREFDGQSHLSVAAQVCFNIHCPHFGLSGLVQTTARQAVCW